MVSFEMLLLLATTRCKDKGCQNCDDAHSCSMEDLVKERDPLVSRTEEYFLRLQNSVRRERGERERGGEKEKEKEKEKGERERGGEREEKVEEESKSEVLISFVYALFLWKCLRFERAELYFLRAISLSLSLEMNVDVILLEFGIFLSYYPSGKYVD